MSKITGNEPSMPTDHVITDDFGNVTGIENKSWSGLTIRQYFAGIAMQGILANPDMTNDVTTLIKEGKLNVNFGKDIFAFIAAQAADALIEELNKE